MVGAAKRYAAEAGTSVSQLVEKYLATIVPGSTPSRVAGRAADIEAKGFHDSPPPDAGLAPPFATVELRFEDGVRTVTVGAEIKRGDEEWRFIPLDGDPVIYEVDPSIGEVVEDLFRERGRHEERISEQRLREQADEEKAVNRAWLVVVLGACRWGADEAREAASPHTARSLGKTED